MRWILPQHLSDDDELTAFGEHHLDDRRSERLDDVDDSTDAQPLVPIGRARATGAATGLTFLRHWRGARLNGAKPTMLEERRGLTAMPLGTEQVRRTRDARKLVE